MRLRSLSSTAPGTVNAVVVLDNGRRLEVQFTTATAGGVTVANPTPPDLFQMESLTAEETRRVVAAVVAFDSAASV